MRLIFVASVYHTHSQLNAKNSFDSEIKFPVQGLAIRHLKFLFFFFLPIFHYLFSVSTLKYSAHILPIPWLSFFRICDRTT